MQEDFPWEINTIKDQRIEWNEPLDRTRWKKFNGGGFSLRNRFQPGVIKDQRIETNNLVPFKSKGCHFLKT